VSLASRSQPFLMVNHAHITIHNSGVVVVSTVAPDPLVKASMDLVVIIVRESPLLSQSLS
jgi:hypothetical protein